MQEFYLKALVWMALHIYLEISYTSENFVHYLIAKKNDVFQDLPTFTTYHFTYHFKSVGNLIQFI